MTITPHIAQNDINRRSSVDDRTTRHAGYQLSQKKRKRIEEVFGWMKSIGLLRKVRHRGLERVGWIFTFTAAAYNLVRIRNLSAVARSRSVLEHAPYGLTVSSNPEQLTNGIVKRAAEASLRLYTLVFQQPARPFGSSKKAVWLGEPWIPRLVKSSVAVEKLLPAKFAKTKSR